MACEVLELSSSERTAELLVSAATEMLTFSSTQQASVAIATCT